MRQHMETQTSSRSTSLLRLLGSLATRSFCIRFAFLSNTSGTPPRLPPMSPMLRMGVPGQCNLLVGVMWRTADFIARPRQRRARWGAADIFELWWPTEIASRVLMNQGWRISRSGPFQ